MQSTVKNATTTVIRQLPKIIPQAFAISNQMVREGLKRKKVRRIVGAFSEQGFEIIITGRPLSLARFSHTPTTPTVGRPCAVKVQIYNHRGFKKLSPKTGVDGRAKKPFISSTNAKTPQKMPYIIFHRNGTFKNSKEQIESYFSLGIPQMILTQEVSLPLLKAVEENMKKNVDKELKYAFNHLQKNIEKGGDFLDSYGLK